MSNYHRILGTKEQAEFRESARKNYNPNIDPNISEVWHPVYRHECYLIYLEYINDVCIPALAQEINESTCNSEDSPTQ